MQPDETGYEPSEVSDRSAVAFVVSTFVVLAILAAAVRVHEWRLDSHMPPQVTSVAWQPRHPELETTPGQPYADYARQSQAWLSSSGWIDQPHGVAHIPIEEAKDLILKDGVESP